MMKAAVIEKPGILVVREVPMPSLGEYDALCELLYGATCSGTDQHLLAGRFPWPVRYPTVLGHESVGRVVRVGPRVRHLKVGDLVTRVGMLATDELGVNWGGFAEYGVARDHWAMREDGVPAAEWAAFCVNQVLPPGSDPRAATMMITWRETLSYVTRMGLGAGSAVLVIGSGGNGLSFVAHAANLGAERVVMVGSAGRESAGRAAGATDYIDYRAPDLPARLAAAKGDEFDFIIDAVGRQGQIDLALPFVKPGGTVGIYGIDEFGRCAINPQKARGTFTFYNGGYSEAETHEQALSFWQSGKLRADIWLDLDDPFTLTDLDQALAATRGGKMAKSLVRLAPTSLPPAPFPLAARRGLPSPAQREPG